MQLSPFYLKRHPEKRTKGDIEEIRRLSVGGLTGVENVFEQNAESFDNLMTQTSESGGEVEAVAVLQTLESKIKNTPDDVVLVNKRRAQRTA